VTVAEMIELLTEFRRDLPVFVCPANHEFTADHQVVVPRDAVMNLVDLRRCLAGGWQPNHGRLATRRKRPSECQRR
jgi:hypothetical protein